MANLTRDELLAIPDKPNESKAPQFGRQVRDPELAAKDTMHFRLIVLAMFGVLMIIGCTTILKMVQYKSLATQMIAIACLDKGSDWVKPAGASEFFCIRGYALREGK